MRTSWRQLSFLDAAGRRAFFAGVRRGAPVPARGSCLAGRGGRPNRRRTKVERGGPLPPRRREGPLRRRRHGCRRRGNRRRRRGDSRLGPGRRPGGWQRGGRRRVRPSRAQGQRAAAMSRRLAAASNAPMGRWSAGQINEIRVARPTFGPLDGHPPVARLALVRRHGSQPVRGSVDLVATFVRVGLVGLLAALMIAVLPAPVRRVADRVATRAVARRLRRAGRAAAVRAAAGDHRRRSGRVDHRHSAAAARAVRAASPWPWRSSWGLPASACAVGRWIGERAGSGVPGLLVSLVVGLAVVFALTVIARFLGLAGLPVGRDRRSCWPSASSSSTWPGPSASAVCCSAASAAATLGRCPLDPCLASSRRGHASGSDPDVLFRPPSRA